MVFIIKLYLRDLNRSVVNMADQISTPNSSHTFFLEPPYPVSNLLKSGLVKKTMKKKTKLC